MTTGAGTTVRGIFTILRRRTFEGASSSVTKARRWLVRLKMLPAMPRGLARRVAGGLVVWAECGGLLWLARSLDGRPMAGSVPTDGCMTQALTLGYRHARAAAASPLGPPGLELRGHEFHYSSVSPSETALVNVDPSGPPISSWAHPDLLASYLHLHLGATPDLAAAFVGTATAA